MAVDKNRVAADATKLVQKGQFDKAIRAYEKILAEDPRDVRVLLKIGELQQKKGDTGAAAATFGRVADAYAEQGFFLKSVAVFKQMLKLSPDDARVNERLAALYQQLGILSDAMAQLQVVAAAAERSGDDVKLLEILQRMTELEPENVPAAVRLGEQHARREESAQALTHLRRASEVLRRGNRAEEWLKVAERVAFLDPEDLPLTRELANVYLAKGDTKRALGKLQLLFKADPKDADTLASLAQAFRDLGQTAKTISVYRELAHLYAERGRAEDARGVWRRVLELDANDEEANAGAGAPHAPAAVPAGEAASSRPSAPPPPASPSAAPAGPRALGPEAIPKLLTETDVYVKYGLHEKALEHLRKVFDLDPDHLEAHEKALRLRGLRNDPAGAGEEAVHVVRLARARGLEGHAVAALERLREIAPDHPVLAALSRPGAVGAKRATASPEERPLDEDAVVDAAARAEEEAHAGGPDELLVEVETPDELLDEAEVVEIVDLEPLDDESDGGEAGEAGAHGVESDETARGPAHGAVAPVGRSPVREGRAAEPSRDELAAEPELGTEPWPEPPPRRAPSAEPLVPEQPGGEEGAEDLDDELAEMAFFVEQGLLDEAREALANLRAFYPDHPKLLAAEAALPPRSSTPEGEEGHPGAGTGAPRSAARLAPRSGEELAPIHELEPEATREHTTTGSRALGEDFGVSAENVLDQFRRGVAESVRPEDQETHYDLGIAYKEMGLLDDALRELELALAGGAQRKEVDCLTMVGLCRMEKSEPRAAIEAFERALRSPSLTEEAGWALRYELGGAYQEAGDREAALYYFQAVVAADASYRDARARAAALGGGAGRAPAAARS